MATGGQNCDSDELKTEDISDDEDQFYDASEDDLTAESTLEAAYSEIKETPEVREKSLETLRNYLTQSIHIENCRVDSTFLLRFARYMKHQEEKTIKSLEKYLTFRHNHPHWFTKLTVKDPQVLDLVKSGYLFALPKGDKYGRPIIFSVAGNLQPGKHSWEDAIRANLITFEALLESEENQVRGFTYIVDCSGLKVSHLTIVKPTDAVTLLTEGEKSIPMRHKDINVFKLPFALNAFYNLCASFMSEKIKKRFVFIHSRKELKAKFHSIDPKLLPREYGGEIPLASMTSSWVEKLEALEDTLTSLDSLHLTNPSQVTDVAVSKHTFWKWNFF